MNSSCVSSNYGNRTYLNIVTNKKGSDFHNGIDMTNGLTIVVTAKGKIVACWNDVQDYTESLSAENHIALDHGGVVKTTYMHMRYVSVKVKVREIVEANQKIGIRGSNGWLTGEHLHYGVSVN